LKTGLGAILPVLKSGNRLPMNNSPLKSGQHGAQNFCKPVSDNLAASEKL
jgi:hypothetical protein